MNIKHSTNGHFTQISISLPINCLQNIKEGYSYTTFICRKWKHAIKYSMFSDLTEYTVMQFQNSRWSMGWKMAVVVAVSTFHSYIHIRSDIVFQFDHDRMIAVRWCRSFRGQFCMKQHIVEASLSLTSQSDESKAISRWLHVLRLVWMLYQLVLFHSDAVDEGF